MSNVKRDTATALRIAEHGSQRGKWARKPKTHCVNGHEFTESNTYHDPKDGHRACNACRAEKNAAKGHKTFGITEQEEALLWQLQCGLCAICGSQLDHERAEANGSGSTIDHDHVTGKVRGILCRPCNLGLGNFQDSPVSLERAIAYLQEIY